jgi:hypothetical protein
MNESPKLLEFVELMGAFVIVLGFVIESGVPRLRHSRASEVILK